MTVQEFIDLKEKFDVNSEDVAKGTKLSVSLFSSFSNDKKGLSPLSIAKIQDYFDALAVERKVSSHFLETFEFKGGKVVAVIDKDNAVFRVRVYDLTDNLWINERKPKVIYRSETLPTLQQIKKLI